MYIWRQKNGSNSKYEAQFSSEFFPFQNVCLGIWKKLSPKFCSKNFAIFQFEVFPTIKLSVKKLAKKLKSQSNLNFCL